MNWLQAQEHDKHAGSVCYGGSWKQDYGLWSARATHPCNTSKTGQEPWKLVPRHVRVHVYWESKNTLLQLIVEVKVSRSKVCKRRKKGGFTEWPNRRMFWRQKSLETPACSISEPVKWQGTQEQLREGKWQCPWKAVPPRLRLLASGREKEKQTASSVQPFSGPTAFQAISTPFWLPHLFRRLVPGRGKKNKGEEAKHSRCSEVSAVPSPRFPLPEGVLMLKYSPATASSCLLLPEW